jgi:hypothetical protein
MKKIIVTIILTIASFLSFAQKQNEVRTSMGIDFVSTPKLRDYLESLSRERKSDFSSAVDFSGSYGRMISSNNQLELEFSYSLNSSTFSSDNGTYDLSYSLIMPSVLYNYVIAGNGYNFKFGGGAGVRILSITEKQPGFPNKDDYSSFGFGFILRGVGNTALSQDVYAHIGADIRYDIIGKADAENNIGDVNFSSLSVGIRLGISYQF